MKNLADWEQKLMINELTQGKELAKQLQIHLNVPSSSYETRELLVHKILNSYDRALSMLKWNGGSVAEQQQQQQPPTGGATVTSESPRSLSGSPHSEDSDREFKDQENRETSRKRKSLPRWSKQVQVCPGRGAEGALDDGFSWRKYGQKDILGATYPRGYYRCTHRNVQGCLATKQVQRSDEDPTVFEITYRGRHTCSQASQQAQPPSSPPEREEPSFEQQLIHQQPPPEVLLNFRTGLKVITQDLDTHEHPSSSFVFPSASNIKAESYPYSPSMLDIDNNLVGHFSPSFISPATSGSNYFSVSPAAMNSYEGNQNLHTSESDLSETVPAATSATNSPTIGLDFPFGTPMEFDPTFTFDNPNFFS